MLFGLACLLFLLALSLLLELMIGNRSLRQVEDVVPTADPSSLPKVSIIIPARNEARNIRQALASMLRLDYPQVEIWVINDRSEDETGVILDAMAAEYPQLQVLHLQELPLHWLGKNYAMFYGACQATGELLLFTDADVVFEPTTLTRAVCYLQTQRLNHVAIVPQMSVSGVGLNVFVSSFLVYFLIYNKPWQAPNPKYKSHIGLGAFNLIQRSVYEAIGTHQAIALRPDDDIKLGKLVKKHGYRQEAMNGVGFLSVEWYTSLSQMIEGLMKNAFSGVDYRLSVILFGSVFQFMFYVFPLLAVWWTTGWTQALYAITAFLTLAIFVDTARVYRINPLYSLGYPFSALCMIYVICRAVYLNLKQQGISWRGTFYSLQDLKKNTI